MGLKNWAIENDDYYEREREEREEHAEWVASLESKKVTVATSIEKYQAELIKMFAEKYNRSVSSICASILAESMKEVIEAIGENYDEWVKTAVVRIIEEQKKEKK